MTTGRSELPPKSSFLTGEELVDELAFQYGRSDRDEKALYWLMRAGNRASALFANDEALSFYASALERATTLDRPVVASEIREWLADVQL